MNDYLSVKEFSAAAGVSTQTIYKQLETRLAPHVKESGGRKYISKAALEEFYKVQQDATELQPDTTKLQPDATKLQPDATSLQSDASEIQPEPTDEVPADQPSLQPTAPPQNGNESELDLLQKIVKNIQKELEEKKKKTERRDRKIEAR